MKQEWEGHSFNELCKLRLRFKIFATYLLIAIRNAWRDPLSHPASLAQLMRPPGTYLRYDLPRLRFCNHLPELSRYNIHLHRTIILDLQPCSLYQIWYHPRSEVVKFDKSNYWRTGYSLLRHKPYAFDLYSPSLLNKIDSTKYGERRLRSIFAAHCPVHLGSRTYK